jgi:hypothetical protein
MAMRSHLILPAPASASAMSSVSAEGGDGFGEPVPPHEIRPAVDADPEIAGHLV